MPHANNAARYPAANLDRFLAGLATRPSRRFQRGATRWDLHGVQDWQQLLRISDTAIGTPHVLRLVLDGGCAKSLESVRGVLNGAAAGRLGIAYTWVQPVCREAKLSGDLLSAETWPHSRSFETVSPKNPAFHSGMKDIVILLPPEDVHERNKRWHEYLEASWIVVAYQEQPGEQGKVVWEFKSHIEARAERRLHSPWLFTADPNGKLQCEPCHQYGVEPLPKNEVFG